MISKSITKSSISILTVFVFSFLLSLAFSPEANSEGLSMKRKFVAQRFDVERSKNPVITALPRYPGKCVLLSALKMPNSPGGATYNERYITNDAPEKVLLFYRAALSGGSWKAEQSGWSVNAVDSEKNFVRVHVLCQDLSSQLASTRFILEYKERRN